MSAVRKRRMRRGECGKNVSCCDAAADGQDRRPGEPIAPYREGRDQLAVADPCRRAIDGGTPGLAREHPCNLGIGESLDEAEQHRERPHDEEGVPTVAAMPPIENRTSAGTPLASQNASCQPMSRRSPGATSTASVLVAAAPWDIAIVRAVLLQGVGGDRSCPTIPNQLARPADRDALPADAAG